IATPTGLRPTAQGCCTRLPWGERAAMIRHNPNGVASHSPGLLYSATLGKTRCNHSSQPQRGCVPQPRVAVLSYPGEDAVQSFVTTPTGLRHNEQHCNRGENDHDKAPCANPVLSCIKHQRRKRSEHRPTATSPGHRRRLV